MFCLFYNPMQSMVYGDDIDPESGDAMDTLLANAVSQLDHQGSPLHDDEDNEMILAQVLYQYAYLPCSYIHSF
jgi:hypothetical protein